jgi:leucyl aminopeptidase
VKVRVSEAGVEDCGADLVAIGMFEDEEVPPGASAVAGSRDASGKKGSSVLLYTEAGSRMAVIGLGQREEFSAEGARTAGAVSEELLGRARGSSLAWLLPDQGDAPEVAAALVEGAVLASFEFDRFRDPDEAEPVLEEITVLGDPTADVLDSVESARISAGAANRARYLQGLPANFATPEYLAERAAQIAADSPKVEVEVLDRAGIIEAGMGGLEAVSSGGREVEPRLITLRYTGRGSGQVLGMVGKAVTFDTGGISIKPSANMHEMKMDMSGGAAVLEAVAAIAELDLELDLIAVLPATENVPSGTALKPGDVITQLNGKTVEVTNTDAEGRLILADALVHCARQGADRLVDVATLTGAVVIGLGSTYAALISDDDELAGEITSAAEQTGELVWRLPLHEEYFELTKGEITDLVNSSPQRKAGTIYAGSFLEQFTEGKPWAHLDIAGTAWGTGRSYWGKGPTGFGTRLLIELARREASRSA